MDNNTNNMKEQASSALLALMLAHENDYLRELCEYVEGYLYDEILKLTPKPKKYVN